MEVRMTREELIAAGWEKAKSEDCPWPDDEFWLLPEVSKYPYYFDEAVATEQMRQQRKARMSEQAVSEALSITEVEAIYLRDAPMPSSAREGMELAIQILSCDVPMRYGQPNHDEAISVLRSLLDD